MILASSSEKSAWLKTNRDAANSASTIRLASFATTLRLIVDVAVRKLKLKAVRIIASHIVSTLPIDGGAFCEPLLLDYLKSLRTLLSYRPHLDHLLAEDWLSLVGFCIQGIRANTFQGEDEAFSFQTEELDTGDVDLSPVEGKGHDKIFIRSSIEEFIMCLAALLKSQTAPIADQAEPCFAAIFRVLQSSSTVGVTRQAAFAAYNAVFSRTMTDRIALSKLASGKIVNIITANWSSRSPLLRDEMLISLVYSQEYFRSLLSSEPDTTCKDLEALLAVLQSEYSRKAERDLIHLEDLLFLYEGKDTHFKHQLCIDNVTLRHCSNQLEQLWYWLHSIGFLGGLLDRNLEMLTITDDTELRPKKPRIQSQTDSFIQEIKSAATTQRICALQGLFFLLPHVELNAASAESAMVAVLSALSHENSKVCSWAMVLLASIARQMTSKAFKLDIDWAQIWQLSSRLATNSTKCRAACHLMYELASTGVVDLRSMSPVIDSIVASLEVNGPSILTDSSVMLLTELHRFCSSEVRNSGQGMRERFLQWLLSKWAPSRMMEKGVASQYAHHAYAESLFFFISLCFGVERQVYLAGPFPLCDSIGKAWQTALYAKPLIAYLLFPELLQSQHSPNRSSSSTILTSGQRLQFKRLQNLAAEFLVREASTLVDSWTDALSGRITAFTHDLVEAFTSFCILTSMIQCLLEDAESSHAEALKRILTRLSDALVELIARDDIKQPLIDTILATVFPYLTTSPEDSDLHNFSFKAVLPLVNEIGSAIMTRRRQAETVQSSVNLDVMEIDSEFDSQQTNDFAEAAEAAGQRIDKPGDEDATALRESVAAHFYYLAGMQSDSLQTAASNSEATVKYFTQLRPSEFIACHSLVHRLPLFWENVSREDLVVLLEYLGSNILQSYTNERSDLALNFCLQILAKVTTQWTDGNDELTDVASQIFSWFTDVALKKDLLSPTAQINFASLVLEILEKAPNFTLEDDSSVYQLLMTVFQGSNIVMKFSIAQRLPHAFRQMVLQEHAAQFDTLLETLPKEADWTEGIALRLYVLAKLAASWPTLLRRGVYHIFESPGYIPQCARYASHCLHMVTMALSFRDVKELYELFASQLLYTWLDSQKLSSIPFSIFDYDSLRSMLVDVKIELTSQLFMRGNQVELKALATVLGRSEKQLLVDSFPKCYAYAISQDIKASNESLKNAKLNESKLVKTLGKDIALRLIAENVPSILLTLVNSMDEDHQVDLALQQHPKMANAASAIREMRGMNKHEDEVYITQQPTFPAKNIAREIEHLCGAAGAKIQTLWTPELYAFVVRGVLDKLHDALGSLHTSAILRKLRTVIALARGTAMSDYCLTMVLHSLRPFVRDIHCAEECVGIMRYLIHNAAHYLSSQPEFFTGIALSTLTSLSFVLNLPQDSTTTQSVYESTQSSVQQFHAWFCQFLDKQALHAPPEYDQRARDVILRSARDLRSTGNATVGTSESALLFELLKDDEREVHVLNDSSKEFAFSLLFENFTRPKCSTDDVMESLKDSYDYAVPVLRSCDRLNVCNAYQLWAGRVLGRAFLYRGQEITQFSRETKLETLKTGASDRRQLPNSKIRILQRLVELLSSDDRSQVSIAEFSIRRIATNLAKADVLSDFDTVLENSLLRALHYGEYQFPEYILPAARYPSLDEALDYKTTLSVNLWLKNLSVALCRTTPEDTVVSDLAPILSQVEPLAERIFPFVLHIVLLRDMETGSEIRSKVSSKLRVWCQQAQEGSLHMKAIIDAVLYLRTRPMPNESAATQRDAWLELDFGELAAAASRCDMPKSALLFVEIAESQRKSVKRRKSRSSIPAAGTDTELLLTIFKSIDEPDSYYGVDQVSSLETVIDRLDYEKDALKSLAFRGAHSDSMIRRAEQISGQDFQGLIRALNLLNLNGLSRSMMQGDSYDIPNFEASSDVYASARKLEQWDLPVRKNQASENATIFRALQCLNNTQNPRLIESGLDDCFLQTVNSMRIAARNGSSLRSHMRTLAVLTEVDDVLSLAGKDGIESVWSQLRERADWMQTGDFDDVAPLLSVRETLMSSLFRRDHLQSIVRANGAKIKPLEVDALLQTCRLSSKHGAVNDGLFSATTLSQQVDACKSFGLDIACVSQFETAGVLWDQGEMTASIKMLRSLNDQVEFPEGRFSVSRPLLLAKLGHQLSEARLEKPDEIGNNYLLRAVKELQGTNKGEEAGHVFHEFASFCDAQLHNTDGQEDFRRIQKLRQRKEADIKDIDRLLLTVSGQRREKLKDDRKKAKKWLELDNRDYIRLRDSRFSFLEQSLEYYLLALAASEDHNQDTLRFCAMWLENSETNIAAEAVARHLNKVPSRKFAPLMNQLSSRLQDSDEDFQRLLFDLVARICVEHPYHGLYQIFSASQSATGSDEKSISRKAAAVRVQHLIRSDKASEAKYISVHNVSVRYINFADDRLDKVKAGSKLSLSSRESGKLLERQVPLQKVPPPTMTIELREDMDYSKVPILVKFNPDMTLASGISAPKIVTSLSSDGVKYKQLVKGGNDDLRQDAIMEQVFSQVSELLKSTQETRQRNLGIRTYKVLPLTNKAGIIEFVPDTIPLHDFLLPAHQKYYPKDWRPNACRKAIGDAQGRSHDTRIQVYREVCNNFQPVMRHFFTELFESPDEWFEKRLAYVRSTSAISILGHVLGLGDRHGHNILLDQKSGEVVHIDLGVSFEQGRILPVPEVVPFRLTRDIVDGMGITKTEGVFRRCCEFTLKALRREAYSILTILDVLRYDPLYSWTVSPLRIARMQQEAELGISSTASSDSSVWTDLRNKKGESSDQDEADRALTVVKKKLSKTLSVEATVNELIQQASDERNLAVLYCGWGAYA